MDNTNWYQHAIFYELLVRGFYDSNGDGIGDLQGVIRKLDYLKWLGIDCVWFLPINQSPLKDGGYDISDYYSVLPEYGTVEDMQEVIVEAHARGMKIIMDLVVNHTSDQHPWFLESKSSLDNPKRDWYMWSSTKKKYEDASIIFVDAESSNWTWDEEAQAYYFHRFFSYQPDLNYDNPEVRKAMFDVVAFWLDMGMDGFRLDSVAYLFAKDGTSCENLPETHAYLAELREFIDKRYGKGKKVLLAEANQWPEDVVDYFGTAEKPECHMCFHFPIMPRLFMSLRREQRLPITEIMNRTPNLPPGGQWGIFLRNHDELTLSMVTDEERDYMWNEYAQDPRMKIYLGIRRRLAPLLGNGRRQIELFYGLLLSLPGTPILYYGDEIAMGDNIYLGDRDGVRTPMQWTGDRNGGFSQADPAQLYLPSLMDPVYGYPAVNVESHMRNDTSLLHWLKRFISIRNEYPVFGEGDFLSLDDASNPSVFAFLRKNGNTIILCVNNLSRFPQPVELNLQNYKGLQPVELSGKIAFPRIKSSPYFLTLAPHSFYWFNLEDLDAKH
jgi:maltose alpha-D-glucosyltransferase/alpha-amylase